MDGVDKCCKAHDECYTRVEKDCGSWFPYTASYSFRCKRRKIKCISTSSWWFSSNKKCKMALCTCDKTLADCYARHPYNKNNYGKCNSK
ncbi:phospholipase A2 MALT0035C-like [Branchiostoma lanceolatum]|uniref:phospholipase A2 MALT0035C-like n=1 Tax=Branchiostoma lanceolatum TaxID=7740 RepID=UPI00345678B4